MLTTEEKHHLRRKAAHFLSQREIVRMGFIDYVDSKEYLAYSFI